MLREKKKKHKRKTVPLEMPTREIPIPHSLPSYRNSLYK